MKKLLTLLTAVLFSVATLTVNASPFYQTPAPTAQHLKKDGTPDMRYSANKTKSAATTKATTTAKSATTTAKTDAKSAFTTAKSDAKSTAKKATKQK
ncbi:hypothetical protein HDF18_06330 [Mucilaginibacter sp. X5P1]|uniref:hypothetical protein n=1 Tax=Mucilaginibacter sp. X5P1 TaxID=2723088 RepID=UPI00161752E3|nr:hypothetical protein [Mucilaginibacter sp. X5P1]MBB6137252.1 hypothetical protein [Mucilaginibacter sp. X5P1]